MYDIRLTGQDPTRCHDNGWSSKSRLTPGRLRLPLLVGALIALFLTSHYSDANVAWKGAFASIPWAALMGHDQVDQLLHQALKLISTRTHVSTSLLQRQLRIGFPRAARLMDQLEEMGAVAPDEGGGRSREVLYRPESAEDAIL